MLVDQHKHVYAYESIRERHLWVRPNFSSNSPHILFVLLEWFVRWEAGGHIAVFLWYAASKICSRHHAIFLQSSHLAFSVCVLLVSMRCIRIVVSTQLQLERISSFIISDRLDFHMIDNLSIGFHAFVKRVLILLSLDEILQLRYVNGSTNFRGFPHRVEMAPFCLNHINSILLAFTQRSMLPAGCSWLCSKDSAGTDDRSSAYPVSFIDLTEHRLLLAFFNVKIFSFIRLWIFEVCNLCRV